MRSRQSWQSLVEKKIDNLAQLKQDWDGEGSLPTEPEILAAAKTLLLNLYHVCNHTNPFVAPISGGTLQIEWRNGDRYIEIQFKSKDKVALMLKIDEEFEHLNCSPKACFLNNNLIRRFFVIPISDCKHGYLYRIDARNLDIGVYDKDSQSFIGIRTKFSSRFLDMEVHYDADEHYGTASPLEELEACPIGYVEDFKKSKLDTTSTKLFSWLEEKEKIYCKEEK